MKVFEVAYRSVKLIMKLSNFTEIEQVSQSKSGNAKNLALPPLNFNSNTQIWWQIQISDSESNFEKILERKA